MSTLIVVGLVVLLVLFLLFVIRSILFGSFIVGNFRRCNVIVDGKKGSGKDVLFAYVIHKRNQPYYSNIDYDVVREGKHGRLWSFFHRKPKKQKPHKLIRLVAGGDMSVAPNTYVDFINGVITTIDRVEGSAFQEKADVYISDAGIYFPSQMDSVLHKMFPSFPIYYALSRHLANHNIHLNAQNTIRVWKALREQADFFVHVVKSVKLPFHILVKCWTYDNVDSAVAVLRPVKARFLNKFSRASTDIRNADHGEVKGGWLIVPKRYLSYDSRAFEKLIYGGQPRIERPKKDNLFRRLISWIRRRHRK